MFDIDVSGASICCSFFQATARGMVESPVNLVLETQLVGIEGNGRFPSNLVLELKVIGIVRMLLGMVVVAFGDFSTRRRSEEAGQGNT